MRHMQRVHHHNGTFESCTPTVQTVVVGGEHDVEASIKTSLQILVGSTELRISGIGFTTQRHLEVTDGNVSTFHLVVNTGETFVIVITAVLLQGCIDLRSVLHQVASNQQAEVVFLSLLNSVRLCRSFLAFCMARRGCQRNEAKGRYQEFSHQPLLYLLSTAACSMGRHFL